MSQVNQYPLDVQDLVEEFFASPKTKEAMVRAIQAGLTFSSRYKKVGPFIALAEMEDAEMRLAMAKTMEGIYKKAKEQLSSRPRTSA